MKRFILSMLAMLAASQCSADTTPQSLPFSQDWSSAALITANNDWSGVPGITAFRGDGLAAATGVDPQTIVAPEATVNVTAQSLFNSTGGGIHEIEASQTIAFQGSGTARAPYINLYLNTTGNANITISYTLKELDTDNAIQQVALQYRVGNSGNYTNVPAGYVADASNAGGLSTPKSVVLPAAADNQPEVQVRIITTDAIGSDSMTGVDDISVTGTSESGPDYAAAGTIQTSLNRDFATGPFDVQTLIKASGAAVAISAVNLSGSPLWTVLPHSNSVPLGTTGTLTFRYAPTANNGVRSTATVQILTSSNTPASFDVTLTGSTIKDTTIPAMKSEVEAGTAGTTVYRVTGYAASNNNQTVTRRQFTLQDLANGNAATRGVLVDDPNPGVGQATGPLPSVGAQVRVTGSTTRFNGLIEFIPTAKYTILTTGTTVTPVVRTLPQLDDAVESVLVRVNGVRIPPANYTTIGSGTNITGLSDATGPSTRVMRFDGDITPTLSLNVTTGTFYNIVGVITQFDTANPASGGTAYQLLPRFQNDITNNSVPVELSNFSAE